jgi:hypothetical protein
MKENCVPQIIATVVFKKARILATVESVKLGGSSASTTAAGTGK